MSRDHIMKPASAGHIPSGGGTRESADDKMVQIRQLLFGDYERRTNAAIARLEARVRELEVGAHQRIDQLQAAMDALSAEVTGEHRSAFEELARGMSDLGTRIRRLPRA